jgi:cytoskeletal protein RodZ
MKNNMKVYVIVSLVVAVVLIITALLTPKSMFNRKAQKPLLPTTEHPSSQPQPTFVERHLSTIRMWKKPSIPVSTSNSSQTTQSSSAYEMTQIPTLARPAAARQLSRKPMTYKDFVQRQRMRDPHADERHRHVRESWMPAPPNRAYWKQVGEEMEARKTGWEKVKGKMGM